jgi:hypothetical protein
MLVLIWIRKLLTLQLDYERHMAQVKAGLAERKAISGSLEAGCYFEPVFTALNNRL